MRSKPFKRLIVLVIVAALFIGPSNSSSVPSPSAPSSPHSEMMTGGAGSTNDEYGEEYDTTQTTANHANNVLAEGACWNYDVADNRCGPSRWHLLQTYPYGRGTDLSDNKTVCCQDTLNKEIPLFTQCGEVESPVNFNAYTTRIDPSLSRLQFQWGLENHPVTRLMKVSAVSDQRRFYVLKETSLPSSSFRGTRASSSSFSVEPYPRIMFDPSTPKKKKMYLDYVRVVAPAEHLVGSSRAAAEIQFVYTGDIRTQQTKWVDSLPFRLFVNSQGASHASFPDMAKLLQKEATGTTRLILSIRVVDAIQMGSSGVTLHDHDAVETLLRALEATGDDAESSSSSSSSSSDYGDIASHMTMTTNVSISTPSSFKWFSLLPALSHSYYTYDGSLTYPPCSKTQGSNDDVKTTWVVMRDAIIASESQMLRLRTLFFEDESDSNQGATTSSSLHRRRNSAPDPPAASGSVTTDNSTTAQQDGGYTVTTTSVGGADSQHGGQGHTVNHFLPDATDYSRVDYLRMYNDEATPLALNEANRRRGDVSLRATGSDIVAPTEMSRSSSIMMHERIKHLDLIGGQTPIHSIEGQGPSTAFGASMFWFGKTWREFVALLPEEDMTEHGSSSTVFSSRESSIYWIGVFSLCISLIMLCVAVALLVYAVRRRVLDRTSQSSSCDDRVLGGRRQLRSGIGFTASPVLGSPGSPSHRSEVSGGMNSLADRNLIDVPTQQ